MKTRLPLIAIAALPLTVGMVFAQTQRVQPIQPGQAQNQGQQTQPMQPGQPAQKMDPRGPMSKSGTNYNDVFLQKLAAQLGVSVGKLKAAALAANTATIDQAVKAGDMPANVASDMKARAKENPFGMMGGRGGPGGPGKHGGRGMHGPGERNRGDEGGPRGYDQDGDDDQGSAQGTSTDTQAQGVNFDLK